jgi:hypothetical protein
MVRLGVPAEDWAGDTAIDNAMGFAFALPLLRIGVHRMGRAHALSSRSSWGEEDV